jgi:signal peptide peptidase SppA
MRSVHNPRCRARHLGAWAIEPAYLSSALAAIRDGTWKPKAMEDDYGDERPPAPDRPLYDVSPQGIGVVHVRGSMMKGWSKFAECDTLAVRAAVRGATADARVRGILLAVDSPGGSVPGTQELADDVWAARQVKPVHAFAEDCCASAAFWVASQAERLTTNALGTVGSIGVFCVLYDESKAAEMEGVKVHVVSTGAHKGAGTPGTPVTDEVLADTQRLVDQVNEAFQAAVTRGRPSLDVAKVATGQVWLGADALRLGLVDAVGSMEQAHAAVVAESDRREGAKRAAEARRLAAGAMVTPRR